MDDWVESLLKGLKAVGDETELWAALLGATVGGIATIVATTWQTRRVFEHERSMAREAHEAEMQEKRRDEQRRAAGTMLAELAQLLSRDAHGIGGGMTIPDNQKFRATIQTLIALESSAAPLADPTCRERWISLIRLAREFMNREVVPDATDPSESYAWHRKTKVRAANDLLRYGRYVRDSLVASIDGTEIPEHLDPPVLARDDEVVWNWDPARKNKNW